MCSVRFGYAKSSWKWRNLMDTTDGNSSNAPKVQKPTRVIGSKRRNNSAERYFRCIKKFTTRTARERYLDLFKKRWQGYKPEPFFSSGNYKRRRAYDLIGGRTRQDPSDACGPVGRLRILAGKPLERSIIDFADLPRVRKFAKDPDAEFDQQIMNWIHEDLRMFCVAGLFIAFVERGRNGKNHINVLHKSGACKVGCQKKVPDNRLFATVCYFSKKLYWNDENVLAYLGAANRNKRVASRIIKHKLGDSRTRKITVYEVEMALNMSLLKPKKATYPS